MTDIFDRAQALELRNWEERQRAAILPAPRNESAEQCELCGEPIPGPRRAAVPGVQTCLACQARAERLHR